MPYYLSFCGCTQPIVVCFIRLCLLCFPLDVTSDGEKLRFCLLFFSLSSSLWFHSDSAFMGWKLINSYFTLDNLMTKDPRVIRHFPSIPSSSLSFFVFDSNSLLQAAAAFIRGWWRIPSPKLWRVSGFSFTAVNTAFQKRSECRLIICVPAWLSPAVELIRHPGSRSDVPSILMCQANTCGPFVLVNWGRAEHCG